MTVENNFSIEENTFEFLQKQKIDDGFEEKTWDEWFLHILDKNPVGESIKEKIFSLIDESFYKNWFDNWVRNFSLNLPEIWNDPSAKDLQIKNSKLHYSKHHPCIVIGRGPSLKKNQHLELLSKSDFKGTIICTDGALIPTLESGVTPKKFPNFFVCSIDGDEEIIRKLYDNELVKKYGSEITGIFSILSNPTVVSFVKKMGIKIHSLHTLFDYNEGQKSFNQISATMIRAKKNQGLPAIQTGGNVGTSSWFIAWRILKCNVVCLIGIDHGWNEDDSWDLIMSHGGVCELPKFNKNDKIFKELFPKIHNPDFNTNCIQDPVFQYYSSALKEFISRSPENITTINATEGGCIFGDRIHSIKIKDFLKKYNEIL